MMGTPSTLKRLCVAALLASLSTTSAAEVLSWQVWGEFTEIIGRQGPMSGHFDYDTADGSFSDYSVQGYWALYDVESAMVGYVYEQLSFERTDPLLSRMNIYGGYATGIRFDVTPPGPIPIYFDDSIADPVFGVLYTAGWGYAQVIPEPGSYAMLLAGLGCLGVAIRRRGRWRAR